MEEFRKLKAQHFMQLEEGERGRYGTYQCKHCSLQLSGSTHNLLKHLAPQGSAVTNQDIDACSQLPASSERHTTLGLYNALKAKDSLRSLQSYKKRPFSTH